MRDNKGQLLLLAVVFLAITLIVLASAATIFLNVKQNQMTDSFATEYNNIKEKFGFALNEKANIYNKSGMSKADAINRSFDETKNDFEILLSYKGFGFDAECVVDDNNVSVNITITSGSQTLTETVNYTIVWEETGPPIFPYNPSDRNLLGSTSDASGAITNLKTNNEQHMVFNSYTTGTQEDDEDPVDNNLSDVDSSPDKGTHSNFENEKAKDGTYDILTEENTGGGGGGTYYYAPTANDAGWTNSGNAHADGGGYAEVTSNNVAGIWYTFGISGAGSISTVKVRTDAWTATAESPGLTIEVSWDGGTSWSPTAHTKNTGTAESTIWTDVTSDTAWDWTKLNDANFRVKITSSKQGAAPAWWRLDFIQVEIVYAGGGDNYELDLEVQFTSVNYVKECGELCIYTGTMGGEDLLVDYWTGSTWSNLFTDLTASDWNNISVPLTSDTFTIRFKGGSESSDTNLDSWQIDAVLLHTWNNSYKLEVEFNGSSNALSWSQLIWTIDSQWNKSSVDVSFQLYNYTLSDYPTSGDGYISYTSSSTPNTDEEKTQTITNNPTDFRDGSDNWKVKVTGTRAGANFNFSADWIEFKVQTP